MTSLNCCSNQFMMPEPGIGIGGCLIATAAYGSALAEGVQGLRAMRDGLLRTAQLGYSFFREFHREYYLFSPGASDLMDRDVLLRDRVATLLVEPFVCTVSSVIRWLRMEPLANGAFEICAARLTTDERALLRHLVLGRLRSKLPVGPSGNQLGAFLELLGRRGATPLVVWGICELLDLFLFLTDGP